jgi:hypothetical protein
MPHTPCPNALLSSSPVRIVINRIGYLEIRLAFLKEDVKGLNQLSLAGESVIKSQNLTQKLL